MVEEITEKTHPDIWHFILKIQPEYPHKKARLWRQDFKGLVARYNDQGWMCTYYLILNGLSERFPDKPEDDSPTEFINIPIGALIICTGIQSEGISIVDVFQNP
uniref:Uncharacterized protein n=1 Tax=viral metagenome TaxID=1070528 RepID=A0A6M3J8D9_9ZZZZ